MLPTLSAAAIGDRSVTASDSEESEYEEIEIEEEIEVEEEVTGDEEDEEEEGNGEDLSLSIEGRYYEKRNTTIISNDMKSSEYDGGIMIAEITNPVNESSTQVNASDKVPHSDEQNTQVNIKYVNDAQLTESRCLTALEIMETNKNPALICKYFSKGLSEGTISNLAISESSEIKPTSQNKNPATDSLFNSLDKDNPPVNAVNLLHDQTTIMFNDEKAHQCDGGITNHTQVNTSDKFPHSEEPTTQVNTKDVNDPQRMESRVDVDPAMESNDEDMLAKLMLTGRCNRETCCKLNHINHTTKGSSKKREVDTGLVCPDKSTDQSLSKKRKNQLKDRNLVFSDSGLSSGDHAGLDPLTKDEVCNEIWSSQQVTQMHFSDRAGPSTTIEACHEIFDHTVPPGEIGSSQQVTRLHVSDRAGCLMVQAMGSVSQLIKCYDKKVKTEKRLRDRIKCYREKKLRKAKRLKKLKHAVRLMSEKEKQTLRMMAEKEAEHKKEVCDLMEKLEKAYRENVQLQRENVGIVNR